MEKSPETAFPGDLRLCWNIEKLSDGIGTRIDPNANFFEKMNVPGLIFRRSEVS